MEMKRRVCLYVWESVEYRMQERSSHISPTDTGQDESLLAADPQGFPDSSPGTGFRLPCDEPRVYDGCIDIGGRFEGLLEPDQLRVGMYQDGIVVPVERVENAGFVSLPIRLFHQDIPKAAYHPAVPQVTGSDPRQYRIDLETKCLPAEGIQLRYEEIRTFPLEEAVENVPSVRLYVIGRSIWIQRVEMTEVPVHHQAGKTDMSDVGRECNVNGLSSGDESHIVPNKGATDFQGSEEVTDPQDVLAVEDDFHESRSKGETGMSRIHHLIVPSPWL